MPDRRRLVITLAILMLIAVTALVPGLLYAAEASLRGLRLVWWLLLLLGGLAWLLLRAGPRR